MKKWQPILPVLALLLVLSACTKHRVEVEPIHITIDVNVKIDRELDSYLDEIFEAGDDIRQQQEAAE